MKGEESKSRCSLYKKERTHPSGFIAGERIEDLWYIATLSKDDIIDEDDIIGETKEMYGGLYRKALYIILLIKTIFKN